MTAHIIKGRRKQLAPWQGDKCCQKARKIMFLCTMGRCLLLVLLLLMSMGTEVEEKHIATAEKCFWNLGSEAEKEGSVTMKKGQGPKFIAKTVVRVEMGGWHTRLVTRAAQQGWGWVCSNLTYQCEFPLYSCMLQSPALCIKSLMGAHESQKSGIYTSIKNLPLLDTLALLAKERL